ncbi:MAG: multicopper oxidase domain-containing protein [Actinomycetota bacterium]|nr:multicopper oxidase domain-containing protein [Actinomycetota bacterium]
MFHPIHLHGNAFQIHTPGGARPRKHRDRAARPDPMMTIVSYI